MKILLTGAFGNIGTSTLNNFISKGSSDIKLSCFDIKNELNEKKASVLPENISIFWGDLRNTADVDKAVNGQDAVIHLAFIIPPLSESKPDFAKEINITGTKNIIEAIKKQNRDIKMIFASSVSVFGPAGPGKEPPRKASDEVIASDNYTANKIECENMLKSSGIKWIITRFGSVPPLAISGDFNPMLFEISLDSRVEFVHTMDVGLALANAAFCDECVNKILLIGGGKKCQIYQSEFISKFLEATGIGMLPESAFSKKPYYTDWMDTGESQALLKYQRYTFDDYIEEFKKLVGFKRYFIKLLSPLIKKSLLAKSPYYKK
ncbi:MAG: NAD(P)-dependent oxidoreductase [Actinobacteria bacterium]|nr:NAD(P)-dependent oxidoreductase [Actinomycetota bacterium]